MNTVVEMMERFCWKSKTRSVWKDQPDLLDDAMARIHSEAAVFDAIIRSKNTTVPSLEKITRTVKFLEQNSFWRSNPFSLVAGTEDDPVLAQATSRLQMKSVRDLWEPKPNTKAASETVVPVHCPKTESSKEVIETSVILETNKPKTAVFACNGQCTKQLINDSMKQSETRYVTLLNSKCVNFKGSHSDNSFVVAFAPNGRSRKLVENGR
ncbi:hypothetical protein FBUS_11432 [Fasciolopsis buskii]|uniref:Uncharacterized protein n=1 Tax=Fasciolopsis buskii TaxID=27845 RepID=A0A8E0S640_9TREM|nr:hypothetical protein FBUS_11432 [Fasciolopsis buski]